MPFHPRGRILAACALIALARPAIAQVPSPIDQGLWSFPGAFASPGSARHAGVALANRWLGEEPFDNPALPGVRGGQVTAMLHRVSRQDLRTDARQFDETSFFFDGAGAWGSLPVAGGSLFLYVHQPVLRLEENAFLRGEVGGPTQPAVIESNGSTRELRAGAGWSTGIGLLRIGAAAEWTRREDLYEVMETSGSPDMGFRHVDFEGDGFGAQAGLRWGEDVPEAGTFIVGAQARWIPELSVEGQQEFILLSGDSTAVIQGERESGFEGGLSASWRPTDALQLLGGVGGRTAAAWTGFGVEAGAAVSGAIGLEFHDVRDPWTVRIGFGLERQEDVPEERATTLGLGLGWSLGGAALDLGLVHRSITRDPEPTSYEDRLAITLSGGF